MGGIETLLGCSSVGPDSMAFERFLLVRGCDLMDGLHIMSPCFYERNEKDGDGRLDFRVCGMFVELEETMLTVMI